MALVHHGKFEVISSTVSTGNKFAIVSVKNTAHAWRPVGSCRREGSTVLRRTYVRLHRAKRERLHLIAPATGAWLRATGGFSCAAATLSASCKASVRSSRGPRACHAAMCARSCNAELAA